MGGFLFFKLSLIFMSTVENLSPNDEIEKMIAALEKLNAVPHDQIVSWEKGYPEYHPDVRAFFQQTSTFWNDYDYVQNMEGLNLEDVATFDLAQIKTVLTKVTRGERFHDGLWAQAVQSGLFVAIQERLTQLLEVS